MPFDFPINVVTRTSTHLMLQENGASLSGETTEAGTPYFVLSLPLWPGSFQVHTIILTELPGGWQADYVEGRASWFATTFSEVLDECLRHLNVID